ncbi:hypothetical protein ACWDFR_45285 [Streptomyces sp. 900105755]
MASEGRLSQRDQTELVILVHGTFAGDSDEAETGTRWWQRGSAVWQWLAHNLPTGTALPDNDTHLFQWSGANTQTERLKAGSELLAELIALEQEGRSYHLVGHSHGGSVIWEALIASELARRGQDASHSVLRKVSNRLGRGEGDPHSPSNWHEELSLRGLRSWTTIGTPFLQFLPDRINRQSFSLSVSRRGEEFFMAGAFCLFVGSLGNLAFGLYELFRGKSGPAHLTLSFAVLLFVLGFVFGAIYETWPLVNGYKERAIAARRAMDKFHGRWLGLWAPDDEAINLLKRLSSCSADHYEALTGGQSIAEHTVQSSLEKWWTSPKTRERVKKIRVANEPSTIVALTDNRTVASLGYLPWTWVKNNILLPFVISKGFKLLVGIAQGNDIPKAILTYCSPFPLPIHGMPEGLPAETANQLRQGVSTALRSAAPLARELLVSAALGGELPSEEMNGERRSQGSILVHTAYFSNEQVLGLIITHIAMSRSDSGRDVADSSYCDDSVRWIMQSKESAKVAWIEHVQRVQEMAPARLPQKEAVVRDSTELHI